MQLGFSVCGATQSYLWSQLPQNTETQKLCFSSVSVYQDDEEWNFSVRQFENLPERTTVVNYDGFAEGIPTLGLLNSERKLGIVNVGWILRAAPRASSLRLSVPSRLGLHDRFWQTLGLVMNCLWTEGWFDLK